MINKRWNRFNIFDKPEVVKEIRKNFRKKFGKKLKASQINKIWKDYMEVEFYDQLIFSGEAVPTKSFGKIEIVKKDRNKTNAGRMFLKGMMITRGGAIKNQVEVSGNKWNYVYCIRYFGTPSKFKNLKFKADKKLSKKLSQILSTTSIDYKFVTK